MDSQENTTQTSSQMQPPAPQAGASDGMQHHTVMGILAYLGILVVIPLIVSKDDPFVKFHVKQGLVLLIIDILCWVVLGSFLWRLWMFGQLINLAIFVLVIMGIINVVQGKQKELPFVGSLASYLKF